MFGINKIKRNPDDYKKCCHCDKVAVVYYYSFPNGRLSRYSCLEHDEINGSISLYAMNTVKRLYQKDGFKIERETEWED